MKHLPTLSQHHQSTLLSTPMHPQHTPVLLNTQPEPTIQAYNPLLCQSCAQQARRISITTQIKTTTSTCYPTKNTTPYTSNPQIPCYSYVAFALLTQNSYANRWDILLYQPTLIYTTHLSQTPDTQHHPPLLHPSPTPYLYNRTT